MKSLIGEAQNSPFVRFLFVGVLNTLFGYSVLALGLFFGMHYAVAYFVAMVLGVLFNFKTIGKFVFRSHDNLLIFRFVLIYIFLYGLNVAGMRVLTSVDIDVYVAGVLLIPPAAIVSFLLNKTFVFNAKTN